MPCEACGQEFLMVGCVIAGGDDHRQRCCSGGSAPRHKDQLLPCGGGQRQIPLRAGELPETSAGSHLLLSLLVLGSLLTDVPFCVDSYTHVLPAPLLIVQFTQ